MPGIDECLLEAMLVPGARGASVVDWSSGLSLGSVGEAPGDDHETTAAETGELARLSAEFATFAATPSSGALVDGKPVTAPATAPATAVPALPVLASQSARGSTPLVEDLILTTRSGYHLVRFLATSFDSTVCLHLWLDRDLGNLALARLRMRDLAERLVLG
ncbi:hypothetical protein [Streptomyces albipurpureus]|uniref:Roadblock/LAMTOR2 domain-containing protein n=1 Tax=Streptomyces albipurpureus TaxID=2897419 RepID=A0ABT0UNF9_9ACTN|nr:hypothetical protein [Streptomyces sp. CWNU-1]MCM2390142.1 hypothetical protein [Streptomyces sp. CWNU-1]